MGKLTEEVFNDSWRESLAWAAGIFEGEGTISKHKVNKGRDRGITMSIRMTDEDIIRRFYSVVKVGHVQGPSTPRNPKWKPLWTWQASSFEHVQAAVGFLFSWLGVRRRNQIKSCLQEYHTDRPRGPYVRNYQTGRFAIQEVVNGTTN